jgi:hypothetical protein
MHFQRPLGVAVRMTPWNSVEVLNIRDYQKSTCCHSYDGKTGHEFSVTSGGLACAFCGEVQTWVLAWVADGDFRAVEKSESLATGPGKPSPDARITRGPVREDD